jgi:hypothetical protein
MFQSTPKHSVSEIWKRLPLLQRNSILPEGGDFKPEFF